MTIIKIISLIVEVISIAIVVIALPINLYGYFAGDRHAENLVKKLKIPISYPVIGHISTICVFIALIAYIVCDSLK